MIISLTFRLLQFHNMIRICTWKQFLVFAINIWNYNTGDGAKNNDIRHEYVYNNKVSDRHNEINLQVHIYLSTYGPPTNWPGQNLWEMETKVSHILCIPIKRNVNIAISQLVFHIKCLYNIDNRIKFFF